MKIGYWEYVAGLLRNRDRGSVVWKRTMLGEEDEKKGLHDVGYDLRTRHVGACWGGYGEGKEGAVWFGLGWGHVSRGEITTRCELRRRGVWARRGRVRIACYGLEGLGSIL